MRLNIFMGLKGVGEDEQPSHRATHLTSLSPLTLQLIPYPSVCRPVPASSSPTSPQDFLPFLLKPHSSVLPSVLLLLHLTPVMI